MAYFITASVNASISQSYINESGSYTSSSVEFINNPINVSLVFTMKKSNNLFPLVSSREYKPSIEFVTSKETFIWLYNNTGSRDSDFNSIQSTK